MPEMQVFQKWKLVWNLKCKCFRSENWLEIRKANASEVKTGLMPEMQKYQKWKLVWCPKYNCLRPENWFRTMSHNLVSDQLSYFTILFAQDKCETLSIVLALSIWQTSNFLSLYDQKFKQKRGSMRICVKQSVPK